jgi:hypothetical protein
MVTTEYDEHGEYRVAICDECDAQPDTLYVDGNKHYCLNCYLEKYKDDFIAMYWDDIVDKWGEEYADGVEKIEIEE